MTVLKTPFKLRKQIVFALIFAVSLLVCGDRTTFAADAKPSVQKQLSAEDKLSVREAQVALDKAQSKLQELMQQAQRELTAAQQELQQIVQALEKKCGGKVHEFTAGNGKAELVCTAGEATPDKEPSKK